MIGRKIVKGMKQEMKQYRLLSFDEVIFRPMFIVGAT